MVAPNKYVEGEQWDGAYCSKTIKNYIATPGTLGYFCKNCKEQRDSVSVITHHKTELWRGCSVCLTQNRETVINKHKSRKKVPVEFDFSQKEFNLGVEKKSRGHSERHERISW